MRTVLPLALVCLSILAALPGPAAADPQLPDDVTAKVANGQAPTTNTVFTGATYTVQVSIYQKTALGWHLTGMPATLQVYTPDLNGNLVLRHSVAFTSSSAVPVPVSFPSSAVTNAVTNAKPGLFDLVVQFQGVGVPAGAHTHQSWIRNAMIDLGRFEAADALDTGHLVLGQ